MSRDEERELLRLRAQLLRLQITAERVKQRREPSRFEYWSGWVDIVPSAAVLWKLSRSWPGSKLGWLPFVLWLLKRWRGR
ncbi:MAG: hypothetical protein Q4A49_05195 [Neisseria sp.]|nr:hypothetical protein [Neisseria sp.]